MSDKLIPADKVRVYETGTVQDYRDKLEASKKADEVRLERRASAELSAESAAKDEMFTPVDVPVPVLVASGLPTEVVDFPPLQVIVDMSKLVNRERFAA